MPSIYHFFIFLTAAITCIIMVPYVAKLSVKVGGLDFPNDRTVHTSAIPRLGGVAIFASLLLTIISFCEINNQMKGLLSGAIIIFLTGLADDLTNLSPRQKFVGEFVAAGMAVLMGDICVTNLGDPFGLGIIELKYLSIPFTVVGIVGVTNAINLIDGLDGLASGVCSIASIAFIVLAYNSGNNLLFSLAIATLGSTIGFMRYNNFPAQIFMGDSGSLLLGYLMGCFSVMLAEGGTTVVSPYLPLIILGIPILDTVTVMVLRKKAGKRLFVADNTHLHHRILGLGADHKFTVLIVFGLTYFLCFISVVLQHSIDAVLLGILLACYMAIYGLLHYFSKHRQFTAHLSGKFSFTAIRLLINSELVAKSNIVVINILIVLIISLTALLSKNDIQNLSLIPFCVLIVSAFFFFIKPAWQSIIQQVFIYFTGVFFVFITTDYGKNEFILGISLPDCSNYLFIFLTISVCLKVVIRKKFNILVVSPFDYLITFISLSVPLIPATLIDEYNFTLIAAKSVILLIGFKLVVTKDIRANKFIVLSIILTSLILLIRHIYGV